MIRIQNYIQYCMGFGYLDAEKYEDDVANQRRIDNVFQEGVDRLMASRLQQDLNQPVGQVKNQPILPQPVMNFLRKGIQLVMTPFLNVMDKVQNLQQALITSMANLTTKSVALMEFAIGEVLSFFFGYKKERTEEKEKREKDDFAETDLFTKMVTASTTGEGSDGRR